ncbi:MAG: hypothetical protein F6K40_37805 [Okeania sp. SIO3I5]|uniref:hypothetical protein n=1 Tax=Okeania sp. SIO3I5 TaxID=2607805 RepID=UPI0013BA3E23|nr:hypothetical protein [Okeania sp. SIO3I5]NEQ41642.1 hypothetical protein [Okeania sp. SIO3I5]
MKKVWRPNPYIYGLYIYFGVGNGMKRVWRPNPYTLLFLAIASRLAEEFREMGWQTKPLHIIFFSDRF